MGRFTWAAALGVAFTTGFAANEVVHQRSASPVLDASRLDGEELCEAPVSPLPAPFPVEDIDLTCRDYAFGPQTTEPPLACHGEGLIRTVNFELPAGAPEGPELPPIPPTMPYITDDAPPATLPPLGDVPAVTPMPSTNDPLFKQVKKFFDVGPLPDVTDKVPLGTPPVSEHPSAVPATTKPVAPKRPDTMELRPSDLPNGKASGGA